MTTDSKRTLFEQSIDRRLIEDRYRKAAINELIPYSETNELIGRDTQREARHLIISTMKALEREGMVFACVPNAGYKRLNDREIVETGERAIAKTRRGARRSARRISAVDYDALDRDQQIQHNAYMSVLSAFSIMTKPTSMKKIERAVEATHEVLPLAQTLEAFKK